MSVKSIRVITDTEGAFTYERLLRSEIHAVEIQLGSDDDALEAPDLDITDGTYGTSFVSEDAIPADAVYPVEAACMGLLRVEVSNGGAEKRGRIYVLHDG